MRSLIAAMLLACFVIPAIGQDDPRSVNYDKHLQITDHGLLDTKKRRIVLDLEALEESLNTAREYFNIKRLHKSQDTCGSVTSLFYPHYVLSKGGRVYACLEVKPLPTLAPPYPGRPTIMPTDSNRILFVGPLCDHAGACPGMLLTEIPKFSPLRDCGTAEGSVVCNPKYAEKSHIYYGIQSCNKEFLGVNVDELEVFKRKRGRFRLCSIDLYRLPDGSSG